MTQPKILPKYMYSFTDPVKMKEWIQLCHLMKDMDQMVCFKFTAEELYIHMVHPCMKAILDLKIPSTWFSNYDWKDSEFFVDTDSLFTIFSLYSDERMISMDCVTKYLTIQFFHENHIKHFSIPIRKQNQSILSVPSERGALFEIETNYFSSICSQLYKFGNILFIEIKKDMFHMNSYGNEKMVVEIQPTMIDFKEEFDCSSSFEIFYILLFLKFATLSPKIKININKNIHFCIEKEYVLNYYVSRIKS
jgi:hypothetical protein